MQKLTAVHHQTIHPIATRSFRSRSLLLLPRDATTSQTTFCPHRRRIVLQARPCHQTQSACATARGSRGGGSRRQGVRARVRSPIQTPLLARCVEERKLAAAAVFRRRQAPRLHAELRRGHDALLVVVDGREEPEHSLFSHGGKKAKQNTQPGRARSNVFELWGSALFSTLFCSRSLRSGPGVNSGLTLYWCGLQGDHVAVLVREFQCGTGSGGGGDGV